MVRQCYAFFAHVRVEKDNDQMTNKTRHVCAALILLWVMGGIGLRGGDCVAVESPQEKVVATDTPGLADRRAPLLIERVSSPVAGGSFKVGDQIEFRIASIAIDSTAGTLQDLTLSPRDPNLSLDEHGWDLSDHFSHRVVSPGLSELRFSAIPLKPGKLELPALVLKRTDGKEVASTQPLLVEVGSAIPSSDLEPQQPAENEPPLGLGFPLFIVCFIVVSVFVLCGALVYAIWRLWKKRQPQSARPLVEVRPEDTVALEALMRLEKSTLLQEGAYKKFYFSISEILKTYIGARFGMDAPESTTRELMVTLTELASKGADFSGGVSDPLIGDLRKTFHQLDRVKFTDYQPEPNEGGVVLSEARTFVMATRRVPLAENHTQLATQKSRVSHADR
jgi:hypothetical protein